tara:strand:+ start:1392 stop:2036 length:645 start_codon:yes stop_codon:yes gene_type:complete
MKIVSVILARGGSKGIPNKNIIDINGKPMIFYVIDASLKSHIHETWVSTDSIDIKKISLEYGAKVLDRPANISKDFSKSEDALIHFADNVDFDIVVFIQPTSPLLLYSDINKGIDLLLNHSNSYDSIFSAYEDHWIPRWNKNIKPKNWDIQNRPMRQEVDCEYVENGAFYITKKNNLQKTKLRYSGNIGISIMPQLRSFQVDSMDDLQLIRKLL